MNQSTVPFISNQPQLEDYWRGIILFGRNVASYKFSLAKSLLELQPQSGQLVKMSELGPVYARNIAEHLKLADKQGTSQTSKFLDGCRDFNSGVITQDQLVKCAVQFGFNNVIDAFHTVGSEALPKRFFIDERKANSGIRITDEFNKLLERQQAVNLPVEVESRWRLVETAWEAGVSRSLLSIGYDISSEYLIAVGGSIRRTTVTGSRAALNGYQKGKCFYCFSDIDIKSKLLAYPEVDHFFPHKLKQLDFDLIDGIWNLVLSCKDCNRGVGGKFDKIPTIRLLKRLHKRNEHLISSHDPLKETLMMQTGQTESKRKRFLNDFYNSANAMLLHQWEPDEKDTPYF